ncbi:hypothetical protein EV421DRAFT_2021097 [Armillaria borealis]|uniref:Uncharacterized protein n=1 Tax=Armillaria borealis TaxID=47425 RepID=A0AA39JDT3_9AGAR|nr:hypothetical protein EV421DRAFT_2021097 [Armillaria borealis]
MTGTSFLFGFVDRSKLLLLTTTTTTTATNEESSLILQYYPVAEVDFVQKAHVCIYSGELSAYYSVLIFPYFCSPRSILMAVVNTPMNSLVFTQDSPALKLDNDGFPPLPSLRPSTHRPALKTSCAALNPMTSGSLVEDLRCLALEHRFLKLWLSQARIDPSTLSGVWCLVERRGWMRCGDAPRRTIGGDRVLSRYSSNAQMGEVILPFMQTTSVVSRSSRFNGRPTLAVRQLSIGFNERKVSSPRQLPETPHRVNYITPLSNPESSSNGVYLIRRNGLNGRKEILKRAIDHNGGALTIKAFSRRAQAVAFPNSLPLPSILSLDMLRPHNVIGSTLEAWLEVYSGQEGDFDVARGMYAEPCPPDDDPWPRHRTRSLHHSPNVAEAGKRGRRRRHGHGRVVGNGSSPRQRLRGEDEIGVRVPFTRLWPIVFVPLFSKEPARRSAIRRLGAKIDPTAGANICGNSISKGRAVPRGRERDGSGRRDREGKRAVNLIARTLATEEACTK